MSTELRLSDDQMAHFHLLLSQELEGNRVELHHTAGLPYREYIKRRVELGESLLETLELALPSRSVMPVPIGNEMPCKPRGA